MSTTDLDSDKHIDMDEPPPTDPSPGVRRSPILESKTAEDDLEKRLAWLAKEVRSTSAEHAKKKRAESVLEAREYKTALVPAPTRPPMDIDLPKINLAVGVDPQRDPTLVGRRVSENEWEFDISDDEELSRTLPLDPHAPVPNPLPFRASPSNRPWRRRRFVIALGVLVGIVVGALLQRTLVNPATKSSASTIPTAGYIARIAAVKADQRYQDWLTVQALAAQEAATAQQKQETAEEPIVPKPASVASPEGTTPANSVNFSIPKHRPAPSPAPAPRNKEKPSMLPFKSWLRD
jgi:hypothetical protein